MAESTLKQIKGIGEATIELLNTVGVDDLATLAQSEVQALHEEIRQANRLVKVLKRVPTEKRLAGWIDKAQGISGLSSDSTQVVADQLTEPLEEVSLDSLPLALTVKKEQIVKNQIAVSDVPAMEEFINLGDELPQEDELVEEEALELEDRELEQVSERVSSRKKVKHKSKTKARGSTQATRPLSREERLIASEVRENPLLKANPLGSPGGQDSEKRPPVEPLKRNAGFDIRKTASPELNEGRKLHSRRYIRGVLNPQPKRVKVAALITFVTCILFPASLVAAGAVIFREQLEIKHGLWFLAVPCAFLFFFFLYLTLVRPLKCRICGQPLLGRKDCFKHVKAHRIPLLGYILPTSIHMLLFHWFRCIYCGTSVRLKE